jgi:hypothetical protein
VNLFSLFIVTLVLVDNGTLELAFPSERKIAKVIELLEELRRDSPQADWRSPRDAPTPSSWEQQFPKWRQSRL